MSRFMDHLGFPPGPTFAGHFDVIAPTSTSWGLVMQALRDLFDRIGP